MDVASKGRRWQQIVMGAPNLDVPAIESRLASAHEGVI